MSIFSSLKAALFAKNPLQIQIAGIESTLGEFIVDFHDRTKLHFVLIFPIMHKVAVKLLVEEFGNNATITHYEGLVRTLTSETGLHEGQFKSFGWPEPAPQDLPLTQELDEKLWKVARGLIARGILKEAIASTLINRALTAGAGLDPLVSAGFLITVLKELRAGVYTPAPEVRPQASKEMDEPTTQIFNTMRDLAYTFKEHSGLDWQHLLPGMQRVCVIYTMRYRGKERALELFRDQVQRLGPLIEQSSKRNPPQTHPITPLHIQHIALFNEKFLEFPDSIIADMPELHPVMIAEALATLIIKLALTHYDYIFLKALIASTCDDIENGKYDFVRKTH
jgi:hypothetical protein